MKNKRARDSATGLFIPLEEARRRPRETTVETIKNRKKSNPGIDEQYAGICFRPLPETSACIFFNPSLRRLVGHLSFKDAVNYACACSCTKE